MKPKQKFITADQVIHPDTAYKRQQARLLELESLPHSEGANSLYTRASDERWKLRQDMESAFRNTFLLSPSKSSVLYTLEGKLRQALPYRFFDHVSHYKFLSSYPLVFLTQPYDTLEGQEKNIRILQDLGGEVVDLTNWSFYYPGRAICLALVVSANTYKHMRIEFDSKSDTNDADYVFVTRSQELMSSRKPAHAEQSVTING